MAVALRGARAGCCPARRYRRSETKQPPQCSNEARPRAGLRAGCEGGLGRRGAGGRVAQRRRHRRSPGPRACAATPLPSAACAAQPSAGAPAAQRRAALRLPPCRFTSPIWLTRTRATRMSGRFESRPRAGPPPTTACARRAPSWARRCAGRRRAPLASRVQLAGTGGGGGAAAGCADQGLGEGDGGGRAWR